MPAFIAILTLILAAASLVLGIVMRPRIRDTSEPASLKDLDAPTASENRPIPVIWGTVKVDGPNVTWYGDLQTVKLRNKKAKATLGYRYSIGMELGLCHGPVDALIEVGFGDKSAWTGSVLGNSTTGENFTVDNRTLFGGDSDEQIQNSGYGGVYAVCTFYRGIADQQSNSYLNGILTTENPGHSGISYLVWNGPSSGNIVYNYDLSNPSIRFDREPFLSGYIGISPRVDNIWFVLKRIPKNLNPVYSDINNGDANPIDVIYELLTDKKFGLGLPSSYIDSPSFTYAQQKIYQEGLGFSDIWDTEKKISEVINDILQYIDGVVYTDLQTGLLTIKLARNDYELNNLPIFDESSIAEISTYSSPSIDETTNQIQLSYIDRGDKFKPKITVAHDLANARAQNEVVSASVSYVGITNSTIANKIAFRDLRVLSYPLDKISFTVNRKATLIRPADVFIVNWPDYGFSNKVFRAIRVNYGQLSNGICEIEAIEDVFSIGTAVYGANDNSDWSDPVGNPAIPVTFYVSESPNLLSGGDHKLLIASAKPDNYQTSYNTYASVGTSSGTYAQINSGSTYTPTGLLSVSYPLITPDIDPTGITITPSSPNTLTFLQNFPAEYVKTNNNLALISDGTREEFIAFETVTKSGNNYTLGNVWRGLLDTVPQAWPSGSRIWFIDYGVSEPDQTFDGTANIFVKVQSSALKGQSELSTATGITLVRRALKPYPPGYFRINGSTSTVNISAGSNIVIDWESRNRSTNTLTKQFDTGEAAESGTKYYLKFFNQANALIKTVGPLDESIKTYTYLNTEQVSDNNGTEPKIVTVQLYSNREGLFSLYPQQRTLVRPSGSSSGSVSYSPGLDTYTPAPAGSASSINGIRVLGTPTNNQVLSYNNTSGVWEPTTITPSVNLSGDVTGSSAATTVEKIRNRSVSVTAPSNGQVLQWSTSSNAWEPASISGSSSTVPIFTAYSGLSQNITVNTTWTDLEEITLSGSTTFLANWLINFSAIIGAVNSDNEKFDFRAVLDNTIFSEVWSKTKDTSAVSSEKHLINFHTVFEDVSPNTTHSIKVQWRSSVGSNVDVIITDKRVTATCGTATFDPSFTPASISSIGYWFKASDLTGLVNSDPVPQMTDFSGKGNHFNPVGNPNRASYLTNQLNGLPAIKFSHNGVTELGTNTRYNGPNFLSGSSGELFMVIKASADPQPVPYKAAYGYFGSAGVFSPPNYPYTDGSLWDAFGINGPRAVIPDANIPISLDSWHLYNATSASGNWSARINGSLIYSTTTNTVGWNSTPFFGVANDGYGGGWDGHFAEIIIFNSALGSNERKKIRSYLANKYGI